MFVDAFVLHRFCISTGTTNSCLLVVLNITRINQLMIDFLVGGKQDDEFR